MIITSSFFGWVRGGGITVSVIYMLYHVFLGFSMVSRNSNYPFSQEQGIQGYQNQYASQVLVAPMFHTHYVNNAAGIPTFQNQCVSLACQHSSANHNQLPLSNQVDQQKVLPLHGSSSNVSSVNHVSENPETPWQDSLSSNVHMLNKIQISTNPRIAPDFPIGTPQVDKQKLEADSSLKPAYVCVSMPKNDVTVSQNGSEAVMQVTVGSFYFILFC